MADVNVPELAESISEAAIEKWNVAVGDQVSQGQEIATIETDKVVLEIFAPEDGVVEEILKQAGDDVGSKEVIARIGAGKGAAAAKPEKASAPADASNVSSGQGGSATGETVEVKVPELAESVSEAALSEWLKQPGESVAMGEMIAQIETDKVMLDVPAPVAGVLQEQVVAAGTDLSSGQLIAIIAKGEQGAATPAAAPAAAPAPDKAAEVVASPSARKLAQEQGMDLAAIEGTGKAGRVTKADVQQAASAPSSPSPAAAAPAKAAPAGPAGRSERREKMSKLRARVAERLLQSQRETAMLTTFNEVDMSAVLALRKQYRDEFEKRHETKLGFMSFFVKAATAALQRFPVINAAIDGGDIVYHDYCDIGIAVGSPRGLVVPVLRSAENLGMAQIEAQIADFGARAQAGSLGIEELTGGTFTITNGGVFGSMLSTPIINPPQSAILGVHATRERPVAIDGQVVVRPINYLALSYDHRLIDGRDAVLFLVAVKQALEDPARLVLDL